MTLEAATARIRYSEAPALGSSVSPRIRSGCEQAVTIGLSPARAIAGLRAGMEIAIPPSMGKNIARWFLVRSTINPSLIYCTDGDFHCEVGPGTARSAKLYRTERGAARVRGGDAISVHECDSRGVEKQK